MITVRCGFARFLAVLFTLNLGCAKTVGAESPPVISFGALEDQVVGRGLAAQWSFNVHTHGPMGYQWYWNGEPLLDATNTVLTLQDVQFADSGLYYAQVTNSVGSATTPSVRLTVVPGMEIRQVGAITNAQWAYTLDVVGNLVYVGIEGNGGGLKIYDVQDPAAPVLLGGLALDNTLQFVGVSDVVVSGERAYIAAGSRGLQILDVSNPAEPARIGQYATTVSATDLIIREPIVYVGTSRGVQIVDVSNPAAIALVASYSTRASVYTLDLEGDTLYVAATSDNVHLLDVSDPAAPRFLGWIKGTPVDTVKVQDGRAFLSGYRGPSVLDVTFPAFPLSLASTGLSQDSRGMNVTGDLILDGGRWPYDPYTQRLAVFHAVGSQVVPIASIAPSGTVEAIEVEEGRIYVAASKGGVDIYELGASSDPPFILGPPRPISCVAGTPAQFSVDAVGGAHLRYQWSKNGESVLNATNRTLRLAAANAADVAEYFVLVENEVGSTPGGTARLDLIETPRVTLVKVNLGTAWGTQVTLAAPAGLQAQVFGTSDFQAWQPVWLGQFANDPIEFFDPAVETQSRFYQLLLGPR